MLTKIIYMKFSEWVFFLFSALVMEQTGWLFGGRKSTIFEILGAGTVAFLLLNLIGLFLLSSSVMTWLSDKFELNRLLFSLLIVIAMLMSIYLMALFGSQGRAFQYGMDHRVFVTLSFAYGVWTFLTLLFLERTGKV